jgi:predicted nicotinamide N-methyase
MKFLILIGSGCGLTSMALLLQDYDVIATDRAAVIPILNQNINNFQQIVNNELSLDKRGVSSSSSSVEVVEYDWVNVKNDTYDKTRNISALKNVIAKKTDELDVVVCSDCIYNTAMIQPLLETLLMVNKSIYLCITIF